MYGKKGTINETLKLRGQLFKYAENHNALQEPYHVTVFWKYYLFVKLAYFVNSYVKLTAGWSFRIVYQPALSQTIAPNAFTWFLKELLTTLWRLWKAFSSKTILLGLHMISVFYFICLLLTMYFQFNCWLQKYLPSLVKMICITAASLAVKTSPALLLSCLLTSSFVSEIRAIWNWNDCNIITQ